MKEHKRNIAKDLRRKNFSLADIAQKLDISKSTASLWLRDFPLHEDVLMQKRRKNALHIAQIQKDRKRDRQILALEEGRKEIGKLTKRDVFMLGIALYIGEGTKWQNLVRVVNSDYRVIKLAIRWLTEICGVRPENLRLRIHGYPDTNFDEAVRFWSRNTGIRSELFQSSVVDRRIGKSSKRGTLPFGTVHLNVVGDRREGTNLGLKIRKWMEVVLD